MRALVEAVSRVRRHLALVVVLAIFHLAVARLAALPLSASLAPVLDNRPAASKLFTGDDELAGELLSDHPALAQVGLSSAQAAALGWALVYWILAGGILTQLGGETESETRGIGPLLGASGTHAIRMILVGLCGLLVRLVPLGLGAAAWFALRPFSRGGGFGSLFATGLAAASVFGIFWSLTTVALDYARAIALLEPKLRAYRAVGRGLRLALGRLRATLLLALFSGGGFLVTGAIVRAISHPLSSGTVGGYLALTLFGIVLVLVRVAIRLAALIACGLLAARATAARPRSA